MTAVAETRNIRKKEACEVSEVDEVLNLAKKESNEAPDTRKYVEIRCNHFILFQY